MRGLVFAAAVLGCALVSSSASAEKVRTNASTKLFAKPGEHETVLFTVKSGQSMTILSKTDRWLKVRFSGRTGYIARSKVDMPEGDDVQRNTRRRPFVDGRTTKRGFGGDDGGPEDRVGADATGGGGSSEGDEGDGGGDEKPASSKKKPVDKKKPEKKKHPKEDPDDEDVDEDADKKKDEDKPEETDQRPTAHVTDATTIREKPTKSSDVAFKAKPTQQLFVEETKGKWTEVSIEEGDIGWVLTSKLDIDDGGGGGGERKRAMDVRARAGVMFISQGMRTTGGKNTVPDNYNIGTSAAAIDLGGGIVYPYQKDYFLGAELAYQYAIAIPGVPYKDPTTMVSSTTSFTVHDLDLRAVAGYDLHNKRGMVVWGRLGFRYQSYLVADVTNLAKNNARIPSETFKAPTIGAALSIPKVTDTIGLNFHVDLAAVGTSVAQTKNLEDGASPSASMYCFGALFVYKWKPDMNIQATYDLALASYSFGAPLPTSMRNHTGTAVSRSDTFNIVTVGINKAF